MPVSARAAAVVAGLIFFVTPHAAAAAELSRANDAARYLAGMQLSAESPLIKFTRDPSWQQHAQSFDAAWKKLDREQISKIRTWSAESLKERRGTLFYTFSGPDFLYANAFFPNASTYVLAGLEPVGRIPEINERSRYSLPGLRASLNTALNLSFFITAHMRQQLQQGELSGTLPILYVFIARSGNTVREASLVNLDKDGNVTPVDQTRARQGVDGAKIVFSRGDDAPQTLYYFRTDLSDSGVKNSGFLKFCEKFGIGDSLLKSASYLLHRQSFSRTRQFLIERSRVDCSGRFRHSALRIQARRMAAQSVRQICWTDRNVSRAQPAEAAAAIPARSATQTGFRDRLSLAAQRIQLDSGREETCESRKPVDCRL